MSKSKLTEEEIAKVMALMKKRYASSDKLQSLIEGGWSMREILTWVYKQPQYDTGAC